MALSKWLLMMIAHPNEVPILLQYYIYHKPKRDITAKQEHPTSGWDRASMRRCWEFLDAAGRSYSAVIKELEGELARVVCLFYLVLRALDTIEDDMTLPLAVKQRLLCDFHIHSRTPGWAFNESGPDEKDRQLLVEYPVVVAELADLAPGYRDAILAIAEKMGRGMADVVARDESSPYLETIADYDLYCHHVAGLVGEGLSLLFAASGKESPDLASQLELSNNMGLLFQKTNIIRDFAEDADQGRFFWPREIWGKDKYGGGFARAEDMRARPIIAKGSSTEVELEQRALHVLSAMSVFKFVAIPATMALATLELCFMNPKVFRQNVKIRKAMAASLIMRSTSAREVAHIFREYARKIHARARPEDPNFIRIGIACGKIEQWCEHHYPSFLHFSSDRNDKRNSEAIDPTDARGAMFLASEKEEYERTQAVHVRRVSGELGGEEPVIRKGRVGDGAMQGIVIYAAVGLLAVVYWVLRVPH
ncbi:Squalene synthase [Mycena sanguinolenta]|uniref:Squalene synthase n=1 Tax=Mycena sanguinolenta TaxID=230812 RepID=A0A8H6ZFS2_9AGAR|nr:Squalene synthase [Mycena sanguinolenta]